MIHLVLSPTHALAWVPPQPPVSLQLIASIKLKQVAGSYFIVSYGQCWCSDSW